MGGHLLSLILFLPSVVALPLLLMPDRLWRTARAVALAGTLASLGLGLVFLSSFPGGGNFQGVEKLSWIPPYDGSYLLGLDGLGLALVLLTLVVTPLAVLAPFDGRQEARSAFYACLLFVETGVLGVFMSLDLVLFYIFWEMVLIPSYFVIGFWGGDRRIGVATKFFLYTLAGSLLMLAGIMLLYQNHVAATGYGTFGLPSLLKVPIQDGRETLIFLLFFAGFAVKAPLWPFHSWLPGAYLVSPTPGTILMAALMSKMGTYGFIRICLPLFPEAAGSLAPLFLGLAVVGGVYGALQALGQKEFKGLIAYSSFSHTGLMLAGVAAASVPGAMGAAFQMVSHGLITGGLLALGALIAAGNDSPALSGFGPLVRAPWTRGLLVFFSLAALGLPGLSAFPGEFLIMGGIFGRSLTWGLVAAVGVALGACYMLRLLEPVAFKGHDGHGPAPRDLAAADLATLLPVAIMILILGLFPGRLMELLRPALETLLTQGGR
jgi:NADH-quinone oxidoreductase subunit M